MILFTNTVCHKMIVTATQTAGKNNIEIARSHSSSATALKKILSQYCALSAFDLLKYIEYSEKNTLFFTFILSYK